MQANPKLDRHLAHLQAMKLDSEQETQACFMAFKRDLRPSLLHLLKPQAWRTLPFNQVLAQYQKLSPLAQDQQTELIEAIFAHFCPNPAWLAQVQAIEARKFEPNLDTETLSKLKKYRVQPSQEQIKQIWEASAAFSELSLSLVCRRLQSFVSALPIYLEPDLRSHLEQAESPELFKQILMLLAAWPQHFEQHFGFWANLLQDLDKRFHVLSAMQSAKGLPLAPLFNLLNPILQDRLRRLRLGETETWQEEAALIQQILINNGGGGRLLHLDLKI